MSSNERAAGADAPERASRAQKSPYITMLGVYRRMVKWSWQKVKIGDIIVVIDIIQNSRGATRTVILHNQTVSTFAGELVKACWKKIR